MRQHSEQMARRAFGALCVLWLLLALLQLLPEDSSAQSPRERPKIICLHATGEYYRGFSLLLAEFLEERVGAHYEIGATNRTADGDSLSGAMDIIDHIARCDRGSSYYLGLTQSDVAYYFLNGGHDLYPTPHVGRPNVVVFARVFPEYLHVFSTVPTSDSIWASTYADHSTSCEKLYMGALGTGTLITSTNVLPILGEAPLAIMGQDSTKVKESFWARSREERMDPGAGPWMGTFVSGAPTAAVAELLANNRGALISLTRAQRRHISNTFSGLYRDSFFEYPVGTNSREIDSIEIPALLVGSQKLPRPVAEAIGDFFEKLDMSRELSRESFLRGLFNRLDDNVQQTFDDGFLARLNNSLHSYSGDRRGRVIIPLHRTFMSLRDRSFLVEIAITLTFLLLSVLLTLMLIRQLRRHAAFNAAFMQVSPVYTMVLAVAASFFWLHACLLAVSAIEYRAFMSYETNSVSPFVEHSYVDLFPKLVHYLFSREDIFPVTRLAQVIWLTIPFIIGLSAVIGSAHVVGPPVIRLVQRYIRGEDTMRQEKHVVICNWHAYVPRVIRQLQKQAEMRDDGRESVLIITKDPDEIRLPLVEKKTSKTLGEHYLFVVPSDATDETEAKGSYVFAIRGDPKDEQVLEQASVKDAEIVIAFPDEKLEEPDSATMITVLKIQKLKEAKRLDETSAKDELKSERPRIIVWCSDSGNVGLFKERAFHVTDVCSAEWAWRVICQATQVEHVSNIYRSLMTSTVDTNEFYEWQVPESWSAKTFREVQMMFMDYNVRRAERIPEQNDAKNTMLLFASCADGRKERLHINPDPEHKIEGGHYLVFLAYRYSENDEAGLKGFLEGAWGA